MLAVPRPLVQGRNLSCKHATALQTMLVYKSIVCGRRFWNFGERLRLAASSWQRASASRVSRGRGAAAPGDCGRRRASASGDLDDLRRGGRRCRRGLRGLLPRCWAAQRAVAAGGAGLASASWWGEPASARLRAEHRCGLRHHGS